MVSTYAYGFPRLGKNREYKKHLESYWQGKLTEKELDRSLLELNKTREKTYQQHVDNFPHGEMTHYDKILDTAITLGLYHPNSRTEYYDLCRGKNSLELTKWFHTNYHYLVPRLQKPLPKKIHTSSLGLLPTCNTNKKSTHTNI